MATWLLLIVVTADFIMVINDLMRIRELLRELGDRLPPAQATQQRPEPAPRL
jgi:hypothetical protein